LHPLFDCGDGAGQVRISTAGQSAMGIGEREQGAAQVSQSQVLQGLLSEKAGILDRISNKDEI